MNIEKVTFEFKQTVTTKLVISANNGYVMPTTGEELVELVNSIKNLPKESFNDSDTIDEEIEVLSFSIEEGE